MPRAVACPGCRDPLDVDDEYRSWRVRCPRCGTEFVPDDELPSRRRRAARAERDDAAAEVYGPSVFLELVGWLGAVGSLALGSLFCCAGLAPPPGGNANGNFDEEAVAALLLGWLVGLVGVPLHGLMIVGARHLRRLTGRPWAVAGAAIAVVMIEPLHLSAGVRALVVLNRPDVRAAFESSDDE